MAGTNEEDFAEISKTLIVLDNGLASFENSLWPKLRTLTHLDLSRCNLSVLPEALCDIAVLQFFEASHNLLTCLPTCIGRLKGLTKLILPFNELSTLPCSFAELNALEHLNLSNNRFKKTPVCFQEGNVNINHLDISFNELEDWSVGPLCGFALKLLNCSHNCLKANPSWLWGDFCRSLEELDLSFNACTNLSSMIRTYTLWRTGVTIRLRKLNLSQCGLSSVHIDLLHPLKALQKLNIGNAKKLDNLRFPAAHSKRNCLSQLSFKQFQSTLSLTELSLCALGLAFLPDDINCLKALEVFDCQDNEIQWLPDTFSELCNLRIAVFSKNKMLYLPDDFGKLTCLEELWLNDNQIGELPSSCSSLQKLRWLDLYDNNLEGFPSALSTLLANLDGLDIDFNYFDFESSVNEMVKFPSHLCRTLKDALRRKIGMNATHKVRRNDAPKSAPVYSDYSSDSRSDCSSDCESTIPEDVCEDVGNNTSHNETVEEENWDLEEGQDDYFDPTIEIPRVIVNMPKRALIIHEVVIGPDSFCPSDIHPSPSIKANKNPFAPDQGQFDDAEE